MNLNQPLLAMPVISLFGHKSVLTQIHKSNHQNLKPLQNKENSVLTQTVRQEIWTNHPPDYDLARL